MKTIVRAALAAVSLAAFVQPAHAEWRQAKSKHFLVYGDMSEADLRRRTERLERFDAAMRSLFKIDEQNQGVGVIYVLNSLSEVQNMFGKGGGSVLGFYNSTAQESHGFVPEKLPFDVPGMTPEVVLFHEYTHHIQLSTATEFFPGWMTEGFAELFDTAELRDDGSVVIGAPNPSRSRELNGMNRWTVERLLDSDDNPPKPDEHIEFYSRGWLTLHYLLFGGTGRSGQLFKYIDLINAGRRPLDAGREAFGDLGKLNSELERYMRGGRINKMVINASDLKEDKSMELRLLTPGEAAMLPLRMQSAWGVNAETAPRLVQPARSVAAQYPNDAFVQRALVEVEYDAKNYAESDAAADRLLALDPQNVMAMVYKGRIAARLALRDKEPARWRTARSWFIRANRADPNHPLPLIMWYDSFVAAGDPVPEAAVTGLRRAIILVPQDPTLRMRMGVELVRAGELPLAKTILAPVAFDPHGSGKNPYAKLLKAINDGATPAELGAKLVELKIDRFNEFTPPSNDEDKPAEGGDNTKDGKKAGN